MTALVQTLLLPLVALVGLIVLVAMNDVTAAVAVPLIGTIAGVHAGAALKS